MSTGNEVAMQQCLMGVQAIQKAQALIETRLQSIEARLSIEPPVPVVAAPAPAPPPRPVPVPQVRQLPAQREGSVPPPAGGGSLPAVLAGALGQQLAPWAGLLSSVLEATVRDLAPTLQGLLAAGQGVPAAPAAPPAALPAAPVPGAAEMTAPGPVEANELAWLAQEGLATGIPVEAVRTTALPPNYQHPPGVAPVPPGGLVVPMPPR